jgi:hypothetical protein
LEIPNASQVCARRTNLKGRDLSINGWHKDLEIIAPNGVQLKVDDVDLLTVGDSVFERFRTLQKRVR